MKLQIKIKSVYGVERIYPVNETAITFIKLLKVKTFSQEHLKMIEKLGFKIELAEVYHDGIEYFKVKGV